MRKVYIPKGNGAFRTIYVPDQSERAKIRYRMQKLRDAQGRTVGVHVHGFRSYRSPVTNASQHIGREYTLSFDLKDFFESCTKDKFYNAVWGGIPLPDVFFPDGAARQGLPSSPIIANITAAKMDSEIVRFIKSVTLPKRNRAFGDAPVNRNVVYTRYADDLTFSFDSARWIDLLKEKIPAIIQSCGFVVNERKTKLQTATAGRRIITGVSVGKYEVRATRKTRRKLRAALHQKNFESAEGLSEWATLKLPKLYGAASCEIKAASDPEEKPAPSPKRPRQQQQPEERKRNRAFRFDEE